MVLRSVFFVILSLLLFAHPAKAGVVVAKVDLSQQRMNVFVNGFHQHSWRISSARRGYRTPLGKYKPTWMSRMHYSRRYDNSPMPHSIFFYKGYAIHGTNYIRSLGRPASHGCVRLHPGNARKLYNLVRRFGKKNTRIIVQR